MTASRDDLFKARLVESVVTLDGLGDFRIRSLSRQEVLDFRKIKTEDGTPIGDDPAVMEQVMVSTALVDPALSMEDVARWQSVAPAGELEPLTDAIATLSGMNKNAGKEAVKRFRD